MAIDTLVQTMDNNPATNPNPSPSAGRAVNNSGLVEAGVGVGMFLMLIGAIVAVGWLNKEIKKA